MTTTTLRVVSETIGDTRKVVEFSRDLTKDEFRAWLETERRWYRFHPCGYGGHWSVKGNTGTYTHWLSCD